ncbi:CoA transferase [Rhodococcus sp. BP-149]|nr:CoA transferase [Rhodococcus sp. BP-288]MBY6696038.1 CoA transferase [Rhodococcus sp. BP-188]MBY6700635.1 CoA transferase [Rhodococcus sp. BP-285]MBY6705032.1 CoA transferase [Rhodococcus sp. BP-283]MBY6713760.1 CoA transferase [Rhodococcus sp. BP-160]MBY6715624.1 CoA transferase [Rhodococcus sp. BP-110]MBY6722080.1 CoA transferase [Rhodococcus sp. BP-142]MBY6726606.1 CoA transferase [Rhodococcus sp. BP-149]MBY6730801.1 CoA transferase [Rhodococcus sp. BP-107]
MPALTGRSDGPALFPPGEAATWARRWARWVCDAGSMSEAVDGAALLGERAAFTGHVRQGRTSVGGHARLLPTAEGWAAVSCARPDDLGLLGAMIGAAIDAEPWDAVARWLAVRGSDEVDERMALLGIAGGCVRRRPTGLSAGLPAEARSVDGAVVVDFSALWAGPLCAHLLGSAGARVIKVETPDRPDGARGGHRGFYDLLHAGHESVVLDPRRAVERDALAVLVDSADIVIEASRPRALARFGLDARAAADRGCTWISITADGRSSNRIGFGDDVAASAGLVAHEKGEGPSFVGDAIADPLTGLRAAVCALDARNEASGAVWDVSMTDVVTSTLGRPAADGDVSAEAPDVSPPRGRTPMGRAPASGAHTSEVLHRLGVDL